VGDEPIEIAIPDKPIDPNMKFDNWELDGFLMRQDNQFGDARIQLNGGRADFDMEFNGSHPPYAYGSNRNGCPSFMADNRIEQGGRMHGTLTLKENLNEREIQFDTTGHRDHSWGVRDWSSILHYKWFHGQVGKDVCVHFWHMHALGWTRNWGYVFKDGLLAEVIDVELDVDFTDTYAQQAMRATLTDEAGRKTFIEGEFYAWYPLIPDPNVSLIESAARAQIDGAEGVGWMETTWRATENYEHYSSHRYGTRTEATT